MLPLAPAAPQRSLRRTLWAVLLPALLVVLALELMASWRSALGAANAAFDRSLLGAIKAMDANISTASGGLSVELPYRMLEFFELTASGQVFYRVASGDGLVEIGDAELPAPPLPLVDGQPQFSDAAYYGVPIRLGSYARKLARPLSSGSNSDRVVIQVAETLDSRQDFTRRLLLEAVARDLLLLGAALGLMALAVRGALRPLQRLRAQVLARRADDLTPMQTAQVPAEVAPLVEAINGHMARFEAALQARRRFIDDASHQLRTPLTTLATQVGFAVRETDPAQVRQALAAIKLQVDDAIRQTNQMLALARADTPALTPEPLDLMALAEAVARNLWPLARERGIDLGVEALPRAPDAAAAAGLGAHVSLPSSDLVEGQAGLKQITSQNVLGHPSLLREALSNLLHNALQHTPRGGRVTVQAGVVTAAQGACAVLRVVDDGPGMPQADRARVGERFLRVRPPMGVEPTPADAGMDAAAHHGSGLGLAIAHAVAQRHGGSLVLSAACDDPLRPGLVAQLQWSVDSKL
ncbi:MAG: sensor histidine kinase [Rhodoferax sp.]